jgi:transposase InsO family protein
MKLHSEARTTPKLRCEIKASSLTQTALAKQYNVSRLTIRKWQNREEMTDKSHRPDTLHTTLTEAQEWLVVELRKTLLLSLDDLTHITKEYINAAASRSGIDRCLRRHGIANLAVMKQELYGEDPPPKKVFKDYEPGYIHIDIKYLPKMPDEKEHQYLYVAIDRASRMVCLAIYPDKTAASTADFLSKVEQRFPIKVQYVLTDNGKEFTDRFTRKGERDPTGKHKFDKACERIKAEHRLTKPRHPQTNGMVERFNGRISDLLQTTRFASSNELAEAIKHYERLYNHCIPQKALGYKTPVQALKEWQKKKPDLFKKKVYDLSGLDSTFIPFTHISFSAGKAIRLQQCNYGIRIFPAVTDFCITPNTDIQPCDFDLPVQIRCWHISNHSSVHYCISHLFYVSHNKPMIVIKKKL